MLTETIIRRAGAPVLAFALALGPAWGVIPGHVQEFPEAGNTHGWVGGSQVYENPGTGGVGGAGDGFLIVGNTTSGRLGTVCSSIEYFGDWIADGATGLSFWILDVNAPQNLELHLSIGNPLNFWQLNTGFVPTAQWTQHTIDFLNPSNWTRTHGTGTFEAALRTADRIHFRHDLAPYTSAPNAIAGDFGLDRVMVIPAPGAMVLGALGAASMLRRRR